MEFPGKELLAPGQDCPWPRLSPEERVYGKAAQSMGTRAWLVILVMGIGTLVVLGILTKVAVDANPELQAMIRFKSAFAQDWSSDGVEEVQLRKAPQKRGHHLFVTVRESAGSIGAAFDDRVAEYFVSRFKGKPQGTLDIEYQAPAFLGCSGPSSFRKVQVNLGPVRVRVADQEASSRLSSKLAEASLARLLRHERGARELLVELAAERGFDGDWDDLARRIEPEVRAAFLASPYLALRLRIFEDSAAPSPRVPRVEVQFDRGGNELDARGKPIRRDPGAQKR